MFNAINNYNESDDDKNMDINNINYIQSDHNLINIDADCKNKTRKANFDENKNKNSIRKDNLFNRLKTRLIDFFIKDLHEIDNKKQEEITKDEIYNEKKKNEKKKKEKNKIMQKKINYSIKKLKI